MSTFIYSELPHDEQRQIRVDQAASLYSLVDAFNEMPLSGVNLDSIGSEHSDHRFEDRYGVVGKQLFVLLNRVAEPFGYDSMTNRSSVLNGMHVLTRVISFAPGAYRQYCAQTAVEPTIDGLSDMLRASSHTPKLLAGMDTKSNKRYETRLSLRTANPDYANNPFVCRDTPKGVRFVPQPDILLQSAYDVAMDCDELPPYRSCPGRIMIEAGWQKAIGHCAASPEYFQADLASIAA